MPQNAGFHGAAELLQLAIITNDIHNCERMWREVLSANGLRATDAPATLRMNRRKFNVALMLLAATDALISALAQAFPQHPLSDC